MLKTMKATIAGVSAAAMLATSSMAAVPAAQAAEPVLSSDAQLVLVGGKGGYGKRHYSGRHHYKHRRGNNFPSGLFFGLAAGAIVGSALSQPRYYAPPPSYAGNNWHAYCSARFKTYKPWTGTYTGYDGHQHRCP